MLASNMFKYEGKIGHIHKYQVNSAKLSQPAFNSSKSAMKTQEEYVKFTQN